MFSSCFKYKFISVSSENNTLKLSTDKDIYNMGETVTITLQNIGNNTIHFSDGGYMHLRNSDTGECIFGCPEQESFTQAIIAFEPGQIETRLWEQRDVNNTQVSPGLYTVRVFNAIWEESSVEASIQFTIINRSSADINSVNKSNTDLSRGNESKSSSNINLTSIIHESQNQIEKKFDKASEAIKLNDSLAAIQSIEQAKQEIDQLSICM